MIRAPASALLAIVLVVTTTRCAPRSVAPAPAPNVPHECEAVPDTVQVLATAEVSEPTLENFLAGDPLGACIATRVTRLAVADARDALDRGAAMLVTSDPATLEYAAARRDRRSTPLAWDREYALVARSAEASWLVADSSALDSIRAELARDVVRGDARPSANAACGAIPPDAAERAHRVAYPAADETARSIAARLVAIAPPHVPLRVAAVAAGGDTSALAIVARPLERTERCAAGRLTIPLIETRARAIVPVEAP